MSNSNMEFVTDTFKSKKYAIEEIEARRAINSKKPGSRVTEVLINN